ncbi:transcriptional regulator [Phyllobacterium sp. SB3]|uniref:transcriptional regulator n=1 Tax=Phyllobacterium sp. SB3 TaxID=3156073 RepID=UPI0032AE8FC7
MADFVAVLRKTIDGLADPTPELRQRVYAKARATIEQKLVTLNAPEAVSKRQITALDDAIAEVEASFAPVAEEIAPVPEPLPVAPPPSIPDVVAAPPPPPIVKTEPAPTPAPTWSRSEPVAPPAFTSIESQPDALEDFLSSQDKSKPSAGPEEEDFSADATERSHTSRDGLDDQELGVGTADDSRSDYGVYTRGPIKQPEPKRSLLPILSIVALLAVVGGVAYAGYTWRDDISKQASAAKDYLASLTSSEPEPAPKPAQTAATQPASQQPAKPVQPAATTPTATPNSTEPKGEPKLTQRLLPDGQEIDPGRANDTPSVGEGTSVAASTTDPAAQPATPGQQPTGQTQPPAALPIGQKAFFYEERSGQDAQRREEGGVVWSVVQESPGNDLPPEPAIRAEVNIPELAIKLRMIIRRNGDKTLPASHLIEMIFTVPEGFAGGSIDNVSRMTFKDREEAPGSPLVAIPAKIADNFFIIAMNDAKTAVDTNTSLMRRMSWIDIPIAYKTGRRALITLEKGLPGERAFDEVLKSWATKVGG